MPNKVKKDLTGITFGSIAVLGYKKPDHTNRISGRWRCICNICGKYSYKPATEITRRQHEFCKSYSTVQTRQKTKDEKMPKVQKLVKPYGITVTSAYHSISSPIGWKCNTCGNSWSGILRLMVDRIKRYPDLPACINFRKAT